MRFTLNNILSIIANNLLPSYFIAVLFLVAFTPVKGYSYIPQKGMVSLATGPYLYTTTSTYKPDRFYETPQLGWGFLAEGLLGERFGLEIGLFYLDKLYLRHNGDKNHYLIQEVKRMYITTGFRYWWARYVSTGINLFSSFSMGDVSDISKSSILTKDFVTSAEEVTEYGVEASLRFEFSIADQQSLAIDTRYSHSFSPLKNEQVNQINSGIYYIRELDIK